jgi:hypothetical protein
MKQAILNGRTLHGYFVDLDGSIWSNKTGPLKKLSTNGGHKYPNVKLYVDGDKIGGDVHRIVCETYHKFPKPNGVTKVEWANTPDSVKVLLKRSFQVNHKDHNKQNFHPSNLEWVTVKENQDAYQRHSKK